MSRPGSASADPQGSARFRHEARLTTPDGTLKMNNQGHLTGTDADGTSFVANIQRHMEPWGPFPPRIPFTATFTTNLVSKGSTVNARIVVTYDWPDGSPPKLTVTACRG